MVPWPAAPIARRLIAVCAVALIAVILFNVPSFASRAELDTATTVLVLIGLAVAWNLIGGYGGQFALGQAAFVGTGAYTVAALLTKTSVPVGVAVLSGGITSALFAAIAALALFRLRGVYFAIGSLALALAAQVWVANWNWVGSTRGISLPIAALPDPTTLFHIVALVGLVAIVTCSLLARGRFGLRLQAVRDDEAAAAALGVGSTAMKRMTFVVSAFFTGLMGAVVALQQVSIDPTSMFGLTWTINMIVMVIVGGIATALGPIVGVLIVYFAIQKPLQGSDNLSLIITGVLLVALVRFAPEGLVGAARQLLQGLRSRVHRWRAAPGVSVGSP